MRALCLTLALFLATPAAAQSLPCGPRAQVLDRLAQLHQTRRAMGQAGHAVMELFAAPETETWTLTVTLRDGRMCLLAQGTGFSLRDEVYPAPGTAS